MVAAEAHQEAAFDGCLRDRVAVGEAVDPDDEVAGRPEDEHGRVLDHAVAGVQRRDLVLRTSTGTNGLPACSAPAFASRIAVSSIFAFGS